MLQQPGEKTWRPTHFTVSERETIYARVRNIGQRLKDHFHVLRMSQIAALQSKYSIRTLHGYHTHSLTHGPLGLALMYDELDRVLPGEEWDKMAHSYLAFIQDKFPAEGTHAFGLFSGSCGLLFTAHRLSRGGIRYQKLCERLAAAIFFIVGKYLVAHEQPHRESYDLSSGAVGIGATLLTLLQAAYSSQQQPVLDDLQQVRPYLSMLVYHLAWLGHRTARSVRDIDHLYYANEVKDAQIGWSISSAYTGYGIRQGVAGLIAFLSLVLTNDTSYQEDEIAVTLKSLCQQLRQSMCRDEQGWHWLQSESGDDYHRPGKCVATAWCNGTCGIARALWLAGHALHDASLCTLSLEIITEAARFLQHDRSVIGPSLCHGLAGMIQVYSHFASETGEPLLAECVYTMTHRLLELFEDDHPFGYRAFEPEYIRVDSPWLLDGASGVALALLTTVRAERPVWDRIMLLH